MGLCLVLCLLGLSLELGLTVKDEIIYVEMECPNEMRQSFSIVVGHLKCCSLQKLRFTCYLEGALWNMSNLNLNLNPLLILSNIFEKWFFLTPTLMSNRLLRF